MIKKSDVKYGYTAKVTQADGEAVEVELVSYNATYYSASCSVAAKEMTDVLSIASYIARNLNGVTAEINMAVMRFVTSAYNYIGGTN